MIRVFVKCLESSTLFHLYDVLSVALDYASEIYTDDSALCNLLSQVCEFLETQCEKRRML